MSQTVTAAPNSNPSGTEPLPISDPDTGLLFVGRPGAEAVELELHVWAEALQVERPGQAWSSYGPRSRLSRGDRFNWTCARGQSGPVSRPVSRERRGNAEKGLPRQPKKHGREHARDNVAQKQLAARAAAPAGCFESSDAIVRSMMPTTVLRERLPARQPLTAYRSHVTDRPPTAD